MTFNGETYLARVSVFLGEDRCVYETLRALQHNSPEMSLLRLGPDIARVCRDIVLRGASVQEAMDKLARARGLVMTARQRTAILRAVDTVPFLEKVDVHLPDHEILIIDLGGGGVYVHTLDLWQALNEGGIPALLFSPIDPPFGAVPQGLENRIFTPKYLREAGIDVQSGGHPLFLAFARFAVARRSGRILLFSHKALMPYFFDLMKEGWERVIAYCDGFGENWDLLLEAIGGGPLTSAEEEKILQELLFFYPHNVLTYAQNMAMVRAFGLAMSRVHEHMLWIPFPGGKYFRELPYQVVPPHVNVRKFYPTGVPRERLVLLTTSQSNVHQKGLLELPNLLNRLPGDIQFLMVCHSSPELEKLIAPFKNVTLVSDVPHSEMRNYYSRARLYCRLGSLDSVPISIVEAMACRTPIMVSPEIKANFPVLEDEKNCLIVDRANVAEQAERIRRIMDDDAYAEQLATSAYELIHSTYVMENLVELFRGILTRGPVSKQRKREARLRSSAQAKP